MAKIQSNDRFGFNNFHRTIRDHGIIDSVHFKRFSCCLYGCQQYCKEQHYPLFKILSFHILAFLVITNRKDTNISTNLEL